MTIIPGIDKYEPSMSSREYKVFVSLHWVLIVLYMCLFSLVLYNFWQIIVK